MQFNTRTYTDSDNFNEQLDKYYKNNNILFYKATNVYIALRILMNKKLIDNNTLVVFDLDDTLVVSNADKVDEIGDTLLPSLREHFVEFYRQLKEICHTAVITGRNISKKAATEKSLTDLGLDFDEGMINLTSLAKNETLKTILDKIPTVNKVIYFDDYFIGGIDTIFERLNTIVPKKNYDHIKFIGVKVEDKPEFNILFQSPLEGSANLYFDEDNPADADNQYKIHYKA